MPMPENISKKIDDQIKNILSLQRGSRGQLTKDQEKWRALIRNYKNLVEQQYEAAKAGDQTTYDELIDKVDQQFDIHQDACMPNHVKSALLEISEQISQETLKLLNEKRLQDLKEQGCPEIISQEMVRISNHYSSSNKDFKQSIIESGQKALEGHKGRGIYSLFSGEHNKRIENVEKILAQLEKDEISSNNAFNQLALEGHWNQSSVLTWSYDSFNTKFISFLALTIPEKNIKKNFAPELFKDAEVKNNNIEKEYKAEI